MLRDKRRHLFEDISEAPDEKYLRAVDAYQQYQGAIKEKDKAYDELYNRDEFSYNVNNDALYDQLVRDYAEGASRAAEDAMGRAVTMTGGYGNSYAQQVAGQTYTDYMGGLSDEADKLYDRALGRYMLQGQVLEDKYALSQDRVNEKYDEYVTAVDQIMSNTDGEVVDEEDDKPFEEKEAMLGYIETIGNFTTREEVESYIDQLEISGLITPEEGDALYEEYGLVLPSAEKDVKNRVQGYKSYEDDEGNVDKGGWNWFGGIDRNAKVEYTFEDGTTEVLTLGQLFRKLINSGMSRREARNEIYKLQHALGISDAGKVKY